MRLNNLRDAKHILTVIYERIVPTISDDCRSEVDPEGSVGEDTSKGQIFPQFGVGKVTLRRNLP
jgi:hypothetical protein